MKPRKLNPNLSFDHVLSPTRTNYSCATNQELVVKVLWKNDWCLSIVSNHGDTKNGFTVYGHWPQLRLNFGDATGLDHAKKLAEIAVNDLEKFLQAKFCLPKVKAIPTRKSTSKESVVAGPA